MAKYRKQTLLVNTFGTLGYLSCLLLWAWVALLYLPLLFNNEQIMALFVPTTEAVVSAPQHTEPSPVLIVFALVITVVVLAVTIFVLLRAPIAIARTGRAVTSKAAGSLEPLITHGKPLPPQEKRRLAASLIKLIKLFLVLVPMAGALSSIMTALLLPYEMVVLISGLLATLTVFWFSAQYITADILGIKPEKLV